MQKFLAAAAGIILAVTIFSGLLLADNSVGSALASSQNHITDFKENSRVP